MFKPAALMKIAKSLRVAALKLMSPEEFVGGATQVRDEIDAMISQVNQSGKVDDGVAAQLGTLAEFLEIGAMMIADPARTTPGAAPGGSVEAAPNPGEPTPPSEAGKAAEAIKQMTDEEMVNYVNAEVGKAVAAKSAKGLATLSKAIGTLAKASAFEDDLAKPAPTSNGDAIVPAVENPGAAQDLTTRTNATAMAEDGIPLAKTDPAPTTAAPAAQAAKAEGAPPTVPAVQDPNAATSPGLAQPLPAAGTADSLVKSVQSAVAKAAVPGDEPWATFDFNKRRPAGRAPARR